MSDWLHTALHWLFSALEKIGTIKTGAAGTMVTGSAGIATGEYWLMLLSVVVALITIASLGVKIYTDVQRHKREKEVHDKLHG